MFYNFSKINNFGCIKKTLSVLLLPFYCKKNWTRSDSRLGKLLVKADYFSYFENKLHQTTRNITNLITVSIKPKNSNEHIRDLAKSRTELSEKPCIWQCTVCGLNNAGAHKMIKEIQDITCRDLIFGMEIAESFLYQRKIRNLLLASSFFVICYFYSNHC